MIPQSMTTRAAAVAAAGALTLSLAPAASAAPEGGATVSASSQSSHADAGELGAHLLDQDLTWEDCTFPDLAPQTQAALQEIEGLACADVTVPRDWHDPTDGETITVRLSVTDTADPERSQGIALVNPGGPGGSGLPWGAAMAMRSPDLAEEFNFVGFDPRGVGQSTQLSCEYQPDTSHDAWEDGAAAAAGCLDNLLTPFITTEQTAYDMDFLRALLNEDRISYVGYSYGTWLGSWYQTLFPSHSHRFLLDSATDLTRKSLQETWDLQPRSRDRQFQDMLLPYMARNHETYQLSEDPLEIRRAWEQAGGTRDPLGALITAQIVIPAMYSTAGYPGAADAVATFIALDAPEADGATELAAQLEDLIAASDGVAVDPVESGAVQAQLFEKAREEVQRLVEVERAAATGETVSFDGSFDAIRCQDGQWNRSRGYWDAWVADLNTKAPYIGPFMGAPLCAHWPAVTEKPKPHQRTHPETLILQSEFDAATPYEAGERSAKIMPNTTLISVNNEGTHGLFPYGTTCVDDSVEAFFLDGTLPKNVACGALPLPGEDQAYQVGGDVHEAQQTVKVKMRTDAVKEANRMVREMLMEQHHGE
ncbi:alpha/beta fold hydrolase [Nesterenkonia xinjiangensis]|uniref:Pimeloyl-ACP methyl ester carboxylesterase n=1 Tax=Nesterenkonia xinjiangensis TaxID=225327 RepID=A0A7Z0KBB2_9MICC|nr:pimeloyl-ACP methyl ester carboxylesterase [Nesterenkonia xinjiangensis]